MSYSGGRLVTYATLGAIAGGVGAAVDMAGHVAGLQKAAAIVAGSLMIIWGLFMLAQQYGLSFRKKDPLKPRSKWLNRLYKGIYQRPPILRAFLLGLSSTLLPCGFLYAFVMPAAATAHPLKGVVVMAAFWAGTLPIMLGLGVFVQQIGMRIRSYLPWISATTVLVLGLLTFWQRSNLAIPWPQNVQKNAIHQHKASKGHKQTGASSALQQLKKLKKSKPKCH